MKKLIIIITIILFVTVVIFYWVAFTVYGTPWDKAKAMQQAKKYLDDTYEQKMLALNVTYEIDLNVYTVLVTPEKNNKIKFLVFVKENGEIWKDQYYLAYFGYGLSIKADEYAKRLFGEENRAKAYIDGELISSYNIPNLNEDTKLEDIDYVFDDHYVMSVVIFREFNYSAINDEAEKILKFIDFLKKLECKPRKVRFMFYKNGILSSKNLNIVFIEQKEYMNITNLNELLPYLKIKHFME